MKSEYTFTKPSLSDFIPDKNCRDCLGTGVIFVIPMYLDAKKFRKAIPCDCLTKTVEGVKNEG